MTQHLSLLAASTFITYIVLSSVFSLLWPLRTLVLERLFLIAKLWNIFPFIWNLLLTPTRDMNFHY